MASTATLRRLDSAGKETDFPLPSGRCGVGVSWDAQDGKPKVDIDLQCVVVNTDGAIIDCAYYNKLKAARGITHSGDETTGARSGIDEQVWVHTAKVSSNVALLIFVIAAYRGGTLKDVSNGKLLVMKDSERNIIAQLDMERSTGCVDVVAAMFRGSGGWALRVIEEPAQQGHHFMDILDLIAAVIRRFIPSAPQRQRVAFAMEKGSIIDLPRGMDSITVGLGWDTDKGDVDLDVSAVLLDKSGGQVDTVFFGRLESIEHGITHSGDNDTGEGAGDDEQIVVNLSQVGAQVVQVVFVVNIYSQDVSFSKVANPYCRVIDNASAQEICKYQLADAGSQNALIIAKIAREVGGRWGVHALGLPCAGSTWEQSMPAVRQIFMQDTKALGVNEEAPLCDDEFAFLGASTSHAVTTEIDSAAPEDNYCKQQCCIM